MIVDIRVTPERQAALLLHAMPDADRDWLLAALSDNERVVLREMLQELRDLGIPADKQLLNQAVERNPAIGIAQSRRIVDDANLDSQIAYFEMLDLASVSALAQSLRSEATGTIVAFLRIRKWSWQNVFVEALGEVKRRSVLEGLQREHENFYCAELLHGALLQALRKRVMTCQPTALTDEVAPPSAWHQRFSGLRQRIANFEKAIK